MPWRTIAPMDARAAFICDDLAGTVPMRTLCARHTISPPTGYKWVARYAGGGVTALADRRRTPHHCPHATPPTVREAVLAARRAHPHWGPRKLRAVLVRHAPATAWPAPSTIGQLLRVAGLSTPRRRRPPPPPPSSLPPGGTRPNALWTLDFKGQFRTQDGQLCYPLTVLDYASRYLLGCQALARPTTALTRPVLERLFREYGLPDALRTDNGPPFASTGLGRLSTLAVWWLRLGIRLERIQPGHPEQNGRHERLHRTLKRETALPPAATRRAQQRRFAAFQREYNTDRPHEALDQQPPATRYAPAVRPYPAQLPPLEYPAHFTVRRVGHNGGLRWHGTWVNCSQALAGLDVGLVEHTDRCWALYVGPVRLTTFTEADGTLHRTRRTSHPKVSTMSPV